MVSMAVHDVLRVVFSDWKVDVRYDTVAGEGAESQVTQVGGNLHRSFCRYTKALRAFNTALSNHPPLIFGDGLTQHL